MKANPIIIYRPHLQKPLRRYAFALVTIIVWTLWISLWLPVITFVAWLLGLRDAYIQLNLIHPLKSMSDLDIVPILGCICLISLGSWAFYNRARFAGKNRRSHGQATDLACVANAIGATPEAAERMRSGRRTVVHVSKGGQMFLHDDDGRSDG